jgi:cytochrome c biogenesis protein CcmG, thiol:disulfide interchange protein DsbE
MNKGWQSVLILMVALAGGAWIHWKRVPTDEEIVASVAARVNFLAPDFELTTLDGKSARLSEQRSQVVLVNFWATWCPPCRAEMQDIQIAAQAHPENFVVLAVNDGEDAETIRPFVTESRLTFPVLLDADGAVAQKYRVQGLPTSFFIDRAGIVRAANMGAMSRAYIDAQIETLTK